MSIEKTVPSYSINMLSVCTAKLTDYAQFIKIRLSSLVVFSAFAGFVIASDNIDWNRLLLLVISGFLVTGSSNGFNEILEVDPDRMMDRTSKRPLPDGRMTLYEAYMLASIMGVTGIAILFIYVNPLCGILGILALVLYTLAYTPLKKKTPFAVLVGAFPGAIPPMLGCVAATGFIGTEAWLLFAIQFIWQFPHFWSIAWVLQDDYRKAGFKMLPSEGGRNKSSALQILVYSTCLLPVSLLPVIFNISGNAAAAIIAISGACFLYYAFRLYENCTLAASKQLMFASFIYLPAVQIALMIDKV